MVYRRRCDVGICGRRVGQPLRSRLCDVARGRGTSVVVARFEEGVRREGCIMEGFMKRDLNSWKGTHEESVRELRLDVPVAVH
jgi:hypothetical protein